MLIIEFRKLIEFGKASYVISIPKKWIRENKLKKGDLIHINEIEEGLIILPKKLKQAKREKKSIIIDVSEMNMREIRNQIISHYIQIYTEIILKGNNIKDNLAEIREMIHNMIALEILEETSNKIVAQAFLNMNEISILDLIKKMDMITREMLIDSKKVKNKDEYQNIAIRDQDVNKICYLIFRTIKYFQHNPARAKEQSLSSEQLLKAWIVSSSIEKIGDQIKRISKLKTNIKNLEKKGWSELLALYDKIENLYRDAVKSYYINDKNMSFEIGIRKNKVLKECHKYYEEYGNIEGIPTIIEKFNFMTGFIQPISKVVTN